MLSFDVYGCIAWPCSKPRGAGSVYCPECNDREMKARFVKSLKSGKKKEKK